MLCVIRYGVHRVGAKETLLRVLSCLIAEFEVNLYEPTSIWIDVSVIQGEHACFERHVNVLFVGFDVFASQVVPIA